MISKPNKTATMMNNQKKVETTLEVSSLSSLFSTKSLMNDCEKPVVVNDLKRLEKFLKLPVKAIPEVPR
jgi:hypothetical protein